MNDTTTTSTQKLYTLRGALKEYSRDGFTDGRFIVRPESRTVRFPEFKHPYGSTPAHDAQLGGYDIWDRETGTLTWVEWDSAGAWVAEIERVTKVRGGAYRRWHFLSERD